MRVALVVAAAIILAGCSQDIGGKGQAPAPLEILKAPDWAIAALANQKGHDHYFAPDHANRTTPNFIELGHDALATQRANGPSGGYLCGDIGTNLDGRDLVVTQSHVDDVVLVVADVTDPNAPVMAGELVVNGLSTYDAAITDDGSYALVAVSGGGAGTLTDPQTIDPQAIDARFSMRSACGVSHGPFVRVLPAPSVLLVDLRDPATPTIVDQAVVPGLGVHSVSTATIDGTEYVAASSTGLVPATLTSFMFFTIEDDEPLGPRLEHYGSYDGTNVQSRTGGYGGGSAHTDATIAKHPGTGQVLAYLANWNGGMIIVDLVQPGVVLWQSEWGAPSTGSGNVLGGGFSVHSTLPLPAMWGDRHITVVGEETITPRTDLPTGLVILVDTTDPAAPEEVARWTLPSDAGGWDEPLIYSPHYMAVVNQTVFVSMYHGGVWAFNATPEHWPYPPTTGMYLPAAPNPNTPEPGTSGWAVLDFAPSIAEVLAKADGTLVSFDSHGGVYTYQYVENGLVEPVANWFESH